MFERRVKNIFFSEIVLRRSMWYKQEGDLKKEYYLRDSRGFSRN